MEQNIQRKFGNYRKEIFQIKDRIGGLWGENGFSSLFTYHPHIPALFIFNRTTKQQINKKNFMRLFKLVTYHTMSERFLVFRC